MTESDPQPQQQEALELKPCPFCGTDKPVLSNNQTRCWEVFCRKCGASVMVKLRQRDYEAVDAWNTRADLPRATADDWSIAKSLVRDWLMERGVALSGVNGEVSRSSINRFKLDLQRRIVEAIANARAWSKSRAQKEVENAGERARK
jgi:Lar family restriction alleviation protein